MKILQILPELNVGGVETGTVDLAKYLVQKGHEAFVVSNGGKLVEDLEKAGGMHYALPVHKKNPWVVYRCIKKLEEIIRNEKIDIVHARSRIPAWIAFFACHKTNTAFLTTCHGYYSKHFFSRVMSWSKLIIAPSEVIGRHMINGFGATSGSIRVIPRSVDLSKFKIPKDDYRPKAKKTITMIGRITPLKGHAYFLKAMAHVVRVMPYVRIWIVGDAPHKKESYRQELEILVKRLGLSDYVEFLGSRKDIPQILSRSDILVMSSIVPESFGRVIVEAQAAQVPVVATRVGGIVEIIDHEKTGLLVLPKDTEAMAQAVLRVLRNKKFADDLTVEAKKKLENKYTLKHMAEKTIEVYNELLNSLRILVIKISSIGDVILVVPSLRALRMRYPQATIYCLAGKEASQLLKRCPYINGMIVIDHQGKEKNFFGFLKFSKKLRRYRFDKIIDFQNNQRSHLLSFLSFPRESYGYDNKKLGFLLTRRIKNKNPNLPPVEHQFEVLKMLGIEGAEDQSLELWPSRQDEAYVQSLLDSEWLGNARNIIGVNVSASLKWESKNWPFSYIAKLCDLLSQENLRVILTGVEKDKEAVRQLVKMTKAKPAVFVAKTDLLQLAALIKRCRVFVTPDSAPMHMAAAMKTPFVALFGPTDPLRHLPPGVRSVVLEKKLKCIHCYGAHCRIGTHLCMTKILPEDVARGVNALLKRRVK